MEGETNQRRNVQESEEVPGTHPEDSGLTIDRSRLSLSQEKRVSLETRNLRPVEANADPFVIPNHTAEFRKRRALNWLVLGLTYSMLYMARYNLSFVNPVLSKAFGWDKTQVGSIISPALFAYGIFAMFNGPIADKIGGRKAIIIGAFGASFFNLCFGLGAYFGFLGTGSLLIGYFATVWMLNSYFQSFGAVSLIKVNAAWFHIAERGVFSAIFGSMIQMGRTLVFLIGPLLVMTLPWQWVFFVPAVLVALMGVASAMVVRNDPQDCGFKKLDVQDASSGEDEKVSLNYVIKKIFTNPVTLSIALAEFCTGFIRHGFEQWFPRYMVEVQGLSLDSGIFQRNAMAVVIAGIAGAFFAGILSDYAFKGRRTPVAALGYFAQILSLAVVWKAPSMNWVVAAFVLNSCAISMVQSMLSGTASMDFGGKKAAATAAGFFDGMQYIGGSLVGVGMGFFLDTYGWGIWGPSMIGFSLIGACLMIVFWNARPKSKARS